MRYNTFCRVLDAPAVGPRRLSLAGAPNSIKGPTEAFRRQSGNHLLIVSSAKRRRWHVGVRWFRSRPNTRNRRGFSFRLQLIWRKRSLEQLASDPARLKLFRPAD
jgi:hypothetical protein